MRKKHVGTGALIGGLLIAPLMAIMFLLRQWVGLPFPPFDVFNWIARVLPGPVITFGIDAMIATLHFLNIDVADSAKIAEQMMAIGNFFLLGVIGGALYYYFVQERKVRFDLFTMLLAAFIFGAPVIAVVIGITNSSVAPLWIILWLALVFLLWTGGLAWTYYKLFPAERVDVSTVEETTVRKLSRKQFLVVLGGSAAAVTVVGAGLGSLLSGDESDGEGSTAHLGDSNSNVSFPNANDPVTPAPGTRPEYTPLKDHYKVFIELEPTEIDGETWRLAVTGMVDNPLMLTIDDLRDSYPPRDQFVTLRCISGRIGTSLIGTTQWTGARLQEILADAGVQEGAKYLIINSADGFYETVDLELVNQEERIMLCYDWDGNPLPVVHGYPLRIWIPDRYGMKQPRWITSIEVTDQYQDGYWVERSWDKIARVNAVSVIDTVAVNAVIQDGNQRLVPVGGMAYAGARGISKVEVRVNGGVWQEAQLRSPFSETTWVLWRFDWPFEEGAHTFEVRCFEGDGTVQVLEENDARPSGATGIHSQEVDL